MLQSCVVCKMQSKTVIVHGKPCASTAAAPAPRGQRLQGLQHHQNIGDPNALIPGPRAPQADAIWEASTHCTNVRMCGARSDITPLDEAQQVRLPEACELGSVRVQ